MRHGKGEALPEALATAPVASAFGTPDGPVDVVLQDGTYLERRWNDRVGRWIWRERTAVPRTVRASVQRLQMHRNN